MSSKSLVIVIFAFLLFSFVNFAEAIVVKNNFVTELLNISPVTPEPSYLFSNPRNGWVFIQWKSAGQISFSIDERPDTAVIVHRGEAGEAMRHLGAGEHTICISGEGALQNLIVRSIPEIAYTYISEGPLSPETPNPVIMSYPRYDWAYLERIGMLTNINTLMAYAPLTGVLIPKVNEWRNQGRRFMVASHLDLESRIITPEGVTPTNAYDYWNSHPGIINGDGLIIDEFSTSIARRNETEPWRESIARLANEGKVIYPWVLDRSVPSQLSEYIPWLLGTNVNYKFAVQEYTREGFTPEEAKGDVENMYKYASYSPERTIMTVVGYNIGRFNLNVNPGANFKVFTEMKFHLLATAPEYQGLYGIMNFCSVGTDEEGMRWLARLYRHYCIEGKTNMLSGDPYMSEHIKNPEFLLGGRRQNYQDSNHTPSTEDWTIEPGSPAVTTGYLENYGLYRGLQFISRYISSTFLLMTRSAEHPNKVSQNITNLEPGKYYSLKLDTGEKDNLTNKSSHLVSITIDNAELMEEFHEPYPASKSYFNETRVWPNRHFVVFRPNTTTAKLTISDWSSDAEPPPPDLIGQKLMYTFVEIEPYLNNDGVSISPQNLSLSDMVVGSTDSYSVVLNSQPLAYLTITIDPDNQIITSPTNITFTTSNWYQPQTVNVSLVANPEVEFNKGVIHHTVASSAPGYDIFYNGIMVPDITVNIERTRPFADAGPDQAVNEGTTVTLNGSASEERGPLTINWKQISGLHVDLMDSSSLNPTFTAPWVSVEGGILKFQLTVIDSQGITSLPNTVTITINNVNQPPVANAGSNQNITTGTTVTLDGRSSYDPDGSIMSYNWVHLSGPYTPISNPTSAQASVTAPSAGNSVFYQLTVTDNSGLSSTDIVHINVYAGQAPVADAGPNQDVTTGTTVTLDGTGSYDPYGSIVSYRWDHISGPYTPISNPDSAQPSVTAPSAGNSVVYQLTVTDNSGLSSTDIVHINVYAGQAPVADAGPNQNITTGTTVILDGTGSYDPYGSIVSYRWDHISGPYTPISNPDSAQPSVTAPSAGNSVFYQLTVTDNSGLSSTDIVVINVYEGQTLVAEASQPAPANVAASDGLYTDKVQIQWTAVNGASGYQVWRNTDVNSMTAMNIVSAVTTDRYDDITAAPGVSYYYWIKATSISTSAFSEPCLGWMAVYATVPGDYDGDAKADPGIYQQATGNWTVKLSTCSYAATAVAGFGGDGYSPMSGDFDGDGKADPAVYESATGNWYFELSTADYQVYSITDFGGSMYESVSGDFDGDGKADPAVYESATGNWYFELSANEYLIYSFPEFGGPAFSTVPGDFDGDGKADPAVYSATSGLWGVALSASGYGIAIATLGGSGYATVFGDFDADSKTDPAVYEKAKGLWCIMLSASDYAAATTTLGGPGFSALAGDYDSDRKADPAVYQRATGTWQVMLSARDYAISTLTNFGGVP